MSSISIIELSIDVINHGEAIGGNVMIGDETITVDQLEGRDCIVCILFNYTLFLVIITIIITIACSFCSLIVIKQVKGIFNHYCYYTLY